MGHAAYRTATAVGEPSPFIHDAVEGQGGETTTPGSGMVGVISVEEAYRQLATFRESQLRPAGVAPSHRCHGFP
jgi:hypothetical protein